ncbi:MAG TPA: hypothetical protein VFP54_06340 [Acidimicrobiales bacterium]|nr:hypothetical protein [Acidimicrobiales bacterium]
MSDDYGPWEPATTAELEQIFAGAPFRWWITGGMALELYAGYSWRDHDDADVGICRADVAALYRQLDGFCPYVAAGGQLSPWDGRLLADSENNLWAKVRPEGPWRFDIVIGDGDNQTWIYRRDPRIRRPWSEVVLTSADGVPYLAPEVQLLFKSKGLRDKDDVDARTVTPLLTDEQRAWLAAALPAGHPWLQLLDHSSIPGTGGRDGIGPVE